MIKMKTHNVMDLRFPFWGYIFIQFARTNLLCPCNFDEFQKVMSYVSSTLKIIESLQIVYIWVQA